MKYFYYSTIARDYDEAFENAIGDLDTIVLGCAEKNNTTFVLEALEPIKCSDKYNECYERVIGSWEVELSELFEDKEDVVDYLLTIINEYRQKGD